jgi:hypothetical protein
LVEPGNALSRVHGRLAPDRGWAPVRGANPILEAPAGHTLCQYAGLNGIPGSGPGIFGYAEEDVLVKHSHLKKHTAVARATAGNSPTPCRVIVIGCVSCNTLSHFRQRVSCNSAHAATIGSVLKVSCNRPTRVVFVIGRVSCKPKIGGALKTSHPPPRPRPSAAPCWPIHRRSWSREHRASCGTRMRGPSPLPLRPVRPHARASASSAALRSTRRASATFKRGAPQAPSSCDHAGTFRVYPLVLLMDSFRIAGGSGWVEVSPPIGYTISRRYAAALSTSATKNRFLTAFSCNHFLETPQAECWPLGREPKPPA